MTVDTLEKSRTYIKEGEFDKAQIILRRTLNENPNLARALELFGDLAVRLGQDNEAIGRYERAGDIYASNNQYAEAIICLEKLLKVDKTKNELIPRIVNLYKSIGLPNEAIKKILELCSWAIKNKEENIFIPSLKEIVDGLQPKNLPLRLSFIKLLLSINRSQEAEGELNKLKTLAEESNDEQILKKVNKLLPQYDGGEEELDSKSRIELGKLLYEIGSKDEAIVEFNKAVSDLIKNGENNEAINVLNYIIEIDPDNKEAKNKIEELKSESAKPEEEPLEAILEEQKITSEMPEEVVKPEAVVEEVEKEEEIKQDIAKEQKKEEEAAPAPEETEEGTEFFKELSKEVEGFVAATDSEAPVPEKGQVEELPSLEGQIADIEFLLKEAEEKSQEVTASEVEIAEAEAPETVASVPRDITQAFDDFQGNILWEKEDVKKKLDFAKKAFDAELYESILSYIEDIKDNRALWPLSLELIGSSFVKLGHYTDAVKTVGQAIFLKDMPEAKKIELRYVLASAYEGLGDFENALKEIEHIMDINPNYKDVKEIYELLGGKEIYKTIPSIEKEMPISRSDEEVKSSGATLTTKDDYPTIEEVVPKEKIPEKLPEEMPEVEEKGERISFL